MLDFEDRDDRVSDQANNAHNGTSAPDEQIGHMEEVQQKSNSPTKERRRREQC